MVYPHNNLNEMDIIILIFYIKEMEVGRVSSPRTQA